MQMFDFYKRIIEEELKQAIPKEMTFNYARSFSNSKEYEYDYKALTKAILEPLWEFLNRGGKRWRPVLMMLAHEATGGNPLEIRRLSIIPELIHNGTLIVDDIEDDSKTRRGKRASHLIFGKDVSINMANFLYFLPHKIISESDLTPRKKKTLNDLINQEMSRLHLGQAMDIHWHNSKEHNVAEAQYFQMCAFKTGCLARLPVKMGAVLAGASRKEINALSRFAEAVGIAFQIKDDILNLTGSKHWGKEVGDDIQENKKSLIMIHFMKSSSQKDRNRMISYLGKKPSKSDMAAILSLLNKYGSIEYSMKKAEDMISRAQRELYTSLPDTRAKNDLLMMSGYLITRKF
ncbi:polyprenyl synthetase family protein [Candidatus Woesearchaeota archaeon]|nr:polyprenyl synthetase family protein [Candidatus Woesearchaeota archaeon]